MRLAYALGLFGAALLSACTTVPQPNVPGGNSGVIVNSRVGTGAGEPPMGAVEGALLGADIGRSLDETDRQMALQAQYEALEYGRAGPAVRWRNEDSGNSGEVLVGSSYEVNRLDCREFTHTVRIGGRPRVDRGTACRQPQGTWRVLG